MDYKYSVYNIEIKVEDQILLYNTYSNAIWIMNKDKLTELKNKKGEYYEKAIKKGFFVNANIEEKDKMLFERITGMLSANVERMQYVIAPTLGCNLKCIYCFENEMDYCKTMHDETWNKTLCFIEGQLKKYPKVKTLDINWFGGEPIICIDKIYDFSKKLEEICAIHKVRLVMSLTTNGTLINDDVLSIIKDMPIDKIQITLDGHYDYNWLYKKETEKQFYSVIDALDELVDLFPCYLRINSSKENKDSIVCLLDMLAHNLKLKDNLIIYVAQIKSYCKIDNEMCNPYDDKDFYEYQNIFETIVKQYGFKHFNQFRVPEHRSFFCGSMRMNNAVIGPQGELYRCQHCLGYENYIIGDVENGFYRNKIDRMYLLEELPDKCKQCNYLPVCAGGCPSFRVINNRTIDCNTIKNNINNQIIKMYKERKYS